jgi:hypothetical protein
MHQNKFHTERINQLKDKIEASGKGGPPLNEYDKKLAEHLKILYKFANKGIRGRGKKRESELTTSPDELPFASDRSSEGRTFAEQLLPPPVSNVARGNDGTFGGLTSPSMWRNDRMMADDVFVGNHGHGFLGTPGDGNAGINGYTYGNVG